MWVKDSFSSRYQIYRQVVFNIQKPRDYYSHELFLAKLGKSKFWDNAHWIYLIELRVYRHENINTVSYKLEISLTKIERGKKEMLSIVLFHL